MYMHCVLTVIFWALPPMYLLLCWQVNLHIPSTISCLGTINKTQLNPLLTIRSTNLVIIPSIKSPIETSIGLWRDHDTHMYVRHWLVNPIHPIGNRLTLYQPVLKYSTYY